MRCCHEDNATEGRRSAEQGDNGAFLLDPLREKSRAEGSSQLYGTERDIHEDSREVVEPERPYDQRAERGNAARGDTDGEQQGEPEVGLRVRERLLQMVMPPLPRGDAHLVHSQPLQRDQLVVIVQELGFGGRIGHVSPHDEAKPDGNDAEENEDNLEVGWRCQ